MSHSHIWTAARDAHLLELRANGLPWHRIAIELLVGRNAAIERARRLGVQPVNRIQPVPRPERARIDRATLPPGHPESWRAITDGTLLAGAAYPFPVFL